MKKSIQIVFVLCLLVSACQFETSTNLGISIEDSELARISEGEVQSSDDTVFSAGEDINFILYNVGKFKEGEDGLHWFDMDLEVLDKNGTVLFNQTAMLGENGHLKLPNGMASSPYATFSPNKTMEAGKYRMKVSIYDKLGKGKATVNKTFSLE